MAVTPRRLKSRELILTTHRLLCLKRKPGRAVQVRTELFMTPSSEKEKDGRHIISGVEPKGEREFVVMTVSPLVPLVCAACRSYSRGFPRTSVHQVALLPRGEPVHGEHVDSQNSGSARDPRACARQQRTDRFHLTHTDVNPTLSHPGLLYPCAL